MPTSLNALLTAWAVSLFIIVGGALYLQLSYDPAAYPDTESQTAQVDIAQPDDAPTDGDQTGETGAPTAQSPEQQTPGSAGIANNAAINRTNPLSIAPPIPALLEESRNGQLPMIAPDGRRAYIHYASKLPQTNDRNLRKIAIIITDMGRIARTTQLAIDSLPVSISFAFSPYSADPARWAESARVKGHESLLMVPMEPLNYPQDDPGPLALLTSNSGRQNINLLRASMARLQGYVGIVNFMGSKFTASAGSIRPVLEEINRRGLLFADAKTTAFSQAGQMSRALGMPVVINNGFIDETPNRVEIQSELAKLESRARTLGTAVGFTHLYPISINTVAAWAEGLEERGFKLVPVTEVADTQPLR